MRFSRRNSFQVWRMRLYLIAACLAVTLLTHHNSLHAAPGKPVAAVTTELLAAGSSPYRSASDDSLSGSKSSSGSSRSSSGYSSSESNLSSRSNTSSSSSTSFGDDSGSRNIGSQTTVKGSSSSRSSSSKQSSSSSGYISIPNLAGSEVVTNIQEKDDGTGRHVKSVQVMAGDSFTCVLNKEKLAVRLYGIDAPEKGQAFSEKAADSLRQLLEGKNVRIKVVEKEGEGKVIALVYADKTYVNEALVKNGSAWVSPRSCKLIFCQEWQHYQQIVKALKLSLWQEQQPVPPWEYKPQ